MAERSETAAATTDFFTDISRLYADETLHERQTTRGLHRALRTKAVLGLLERHVAPGGTIVDVGCGPAQLARPLTERGFHYIGVDPVPEMFEGTRGAMAAEPLASFLAGTAQELPVADATADGTALVAVIEYVPDVDAVLAEVKRVTKPGGIVVVTVPNLLNPSQSLRTLTRPVLGPLLRVVMRRSRLSKTTYASRAYLRPFVPSLLMRTFRKHGFESVELVHQSFCMHLRSRPLRDGEVERHLRRERWGARRTPWLGADFICCLRRP